MMWNLEKLEQERLDLIEVITALRHTERLSTADRTSIFEKITAHMVRLSEARRRENADSVGLGGELKIAKADWALQIGARQRLSILLRSFWSG